MTKDTQTVDEIMRGFEKFWIKNIASDEEGNPKPLGAYAKCQSYWKQKLNQVRDDGKKEEQEKVGTYAWCKNCNRGRLISPMGLCPGCLKHGSIVFDSDINILENNSTS